jgi:diaminohydroxyphosphoribosylaminopyrimidine deaminase/5-amino-6-(5-phosphoribosylamino)uracil reductase
MQDPNPLVCGKGIGMLREAEVKAELGLFGEEALRIIEPFACFVTTGRPLVVGKVGMSLDGRIATVTGDSRWITSQAGRKFGQSLRRQLDAILVGAGTILADDPQLTDRESSERGRRLIRVILDSLLRTPPRARALRNAPDSPTLIFCGPDAPRSRWKRLENMGAEVIAVTRDRGGLRLKEVLRELARRKVLGVLVEGGSEVHWSFLSQKLVDKFYFIIAPIVIGGKLSVPSIGGPGFSKIRSAPRLQIARSFRAGPDRILETYPAFSRSIASPWLSSGTLPSPAQDSASASARK